MELSVIMSIKDDLNNLYLEILYFVEWNNKPVLVVCETTKSLDIFYRALLEEYDALNKSYDSLDTLRQKEIRDHLARTTIIMTTPEEARLRGRSPAFLAVEKDVLKDPAAKERILIMKSVDPKHFSYRESIL